MNILVTGGTGTVGSNVVRALLSRDAHVHVLTRDPSKASALPEGVTAVEGNLLEPASVRRVFDGMDAVFLLNPVSATEAHEALLALCGMRLADVRRVVYLSVHHVERAPWLPHFGSKVGVEAAIKAAGIPWTILRPDNFFQNDYWFKDALLQAGVYPQPIGDVGTSRVDVRDIAEMAALALTADGHQEQTYDLVGPDIVTGASAAAEWSRALGRPVRYGGNDLDAWEQQSLAYLPDWMVFDFRQMYGYFQEQGLRADPGAVEKLTSLLGHAPRPFSAFCTETAAAWGDTQA